MSPSRTVDILITGKIRSREICLGVFSMAARLRAAGVFRRIVFSGWREDFEQHADLIQQLEALQVVLVDNGPALPVRSIGHYWEQVKTLQGGLACIEDGVHVFKTRTDMLFFEGDETVRGLVSKNVGFPSGMEGFSEKIWIPSFVGVQPFFMADQCFLGLAEDLRKFIAYDATFESSGVHVPLFPGSQTHPSAASAEIRFWITPFLHKFQFLREYLDIVPYSMNGYPHYPALQEYQLQSGLYQEYLAVYWQVLHRLFRVSEGSFVISNGLDEQGRIIVRAKAHTHNPDDFIHAVRHLESPFPVSFSSDQSLSNFLCGDATAPFFEVYSQAASRVSVYAYSAERRDGYRRYKQELAQLAGFSQH
jgi:hypothetical protein